MLISTPFHNVICHISLSSMVMVMRRIFFFVPFMKCSQPFLLWSTFNTKKKRFVILRLIFLFHNNAKQFGREKYLTINEEIDNITKTRDKNC